MDAIKAMAARKKCTAGQLTLAWLLAQGEHVIPIPGTTRIPNFDENIGALNVKLTETENKEFRAAVQKCEVAGGRYGEAIAQWLYVTTKPL